GAIGFVEQPRKPRGIVGLADPAIDAALDDLGRTAARADDGGHTHGEGFEHGIGERIVAAGKDKAVGSGIKRPHVFAAAEEAYPVAQRRGLLGEAATFAVGADDHQPERALLGELQRLDRRIEALARESRADEEEDRVARLAAELGARGAAQLVALAR